MNDDNDIRKKSNFISAYLGWYSVGLGLIAVALGMLSLAITFKTSQNGATFKPDWVRWSPKFGQVVK